MSKIAKFIGKEDTDGKFERILDQVTGYRVIELARRNSTQLTTEQETAIRLKFQEQAILAPVPAPSDQPKRGPLGMLQQMTAAEERFGVSNRGIFSELGTVNIGVGGKKTELNQALELGKQQRRSDLQTALLFRKENSSFVPQTLDIIRDAFSIVFGEHFIEGVKTYENLYEEIVGAVYPKLVEQKEVRSSDLSSSTNRKTLVGKITGKLFRRRTTSEQTS